MTQAIEARTRLQLDGQEQQAQDLEDYKPMPAGAGQQAPHGKGAEVLTIWTWLKKGRRRPTSPPRSSPGVLRNSALEEERRLCRAWAAVRASSGNTCWRSADLNVVDLTATSRKRGPIRLSNSGHIRTPRTSQPQGVNNRKHSSRKRASNGMIAA